jgi:hypothetical protein
MTRLDWVPMNGRTARVAYTVLGILLFVLLTGLWAYLWVH